MLEELFNLVKGSAKDSVINNTDVPNEHNDAVIAEATNTVASGLRNMVSGGGLQSIVSLFSGKNINNQQQTAGSGMLSNPMVNMMVGHLTEKLMSKFHLGGAQASGVANNLIPSVLSNLVHKTNDPNNSSFSLEGLLNSITGGQASQVASSAGGGNGLMDLIGKFTNSSQDGSGGNPGGLMDIVSKLAGGAQSQQQQNGGGGLMNIIKGFLNK